MKRGSTFSILLLPLLATQAWAESNPIPVSRRPYVEPYPSKPDLSEYPVGREVMLECDTCTQPVRVKAVTHGMVKAEAQLLGRVTVGQEVFLNPRRFFVHRVSQNTLMLRPA